MGQFNYFSHGITVSKKIEFESNSMFKFSVSISMQQRPNVMRILCPLLIITPELVLVPKQWTGLSTGAGLYKNQGMVLCLFLVCFPCLRYVYGYDAGNCLVIQWLKFYLLVEGISCSIPDQRAKISYALWSKSQKHNREALFKSKPSVSQSLLCKSCNIPLVPSLINKSNKIFTKCEKKFMAKVTFFPPHPKAMLLGS